MSHTASFLQELALAGVTLWAEGEAIRYRGDKTFLTAARLAEIKTRKTELLAYLQQEGSYAPLSHGQQALWFVHQQDPTSDAYHIPLAFRIHTPDLDPGRLRQVLDQLAARHAMLRARFATVAGKPVQQIAPQLKPGWTTVDAMDWTETALMAHLDADARRPFSLEQGPLWRATLFVQNSSPGAFTGVLLLTLHHIIFDHWSIPLLGTELCTLYQQEEITPLPSRTYLDFIYWELNYLSQEGQTLARYWRQQLQPAADTPLPVLEFPTDHPRPPVQRLRGATCEFRLSLELSQQLRALARAEGTTLYTLLLAAYQVLLYRYTGQNTLLIGSPTSGNRAQADFAGIIGYFVNPIVLRAEVTADLPFHTLLAQTRQTVLEGLAHQAYPFPLLVQQLQPLRDASRSPIFQTIFVHQKLPPKTTVPPKTAPQTLELEGLPIRRMEGQFDLILLMEEPEEPGAALMGAFKYHTDLFEPSTLARLTDHWQTLLAGLVQQPTQTIGRLPLLPRSEQQQVVVNWNATEQPIPAHLGIHHLFADQARQRPTAQALVYVDPQTATAPERSAPAGLVQLTYAELDRQAEQVADRLRTLGVGPEVLVGLYVERSPAMVIGLLGILKAGGAYLPLDPTYPEDRLIWMMHDAQIHWVLTQSSLCQTQVARQPAIPSVLIDPGPEIAASTPHQASEEGVAPNQLAYVIYTSGSTGTPKGVQIEHQGLTNLATAQIRAFGVMPGHRVLQFASFNFDASISEIAMALCAGATLYLAPAPALLPGPPLQKLLQEHAITHVTLTPSTLAMLPPASFPALETLIVAGEACPGYLVQQWSQGRRFFNAYGPSENTVCTTIMACTETAYAAGDGGPPIGRPIANVQVYLLDPEQQPVPIGVPGELYVGGIGVGRGYLNRPELTAERFIEWRTAEETMLSSHKPPPKRLYKTGDLARYLPDGTIEFLGRLDHQVKVRGYRVELEEIESRLLSHPGVQDAVVIADGEAADRRLLAYWTPGAHTAVSSAELRLHLGQTLPEYMLPAHFIQLPTLPLTPNGKVDRRALPAPADVALANAAHVPPQSALEQKLVALWANVLQAPAVGIHDNFFEIGGHSLLAMRLLSRIEESLGRPLTLATLLQNPTVAQLARQLAPVAEQTATTKPPGRVADTDWSPLVPLQPQGQHPPFFFIHPIGGNVLCYRALAQALGTDHPFYGLQSPSLQAEATTASPRIEEMAALYRQAVAKVCPHGPYRIGGWSMGGVIAYEMACQWAQEGKPVATVVLIESYVPTPTRPEPGSLYHSSMDPKGRQPEKLPDLLMAFFHDLVRLTDGKTLLPTPTLNGETETDAFAAWLAAAQQAGALAPDVTAQDLAPFWRTFCMHAAALTDYRPQPYPGEIVLFRGDAYRTPDLDPAMSAWQTLTKVESHWLSGDHYTIVQPPSVETIAQQVAAYTQRHNIP
jgi:amino acid adenylation domain-containing protein